MLIYMYMYIHVCIYICGGMMLIYHVYIIMSYPESDFMGQSIENHDLFVVWWFQNASPGSDQTTLSVPCLLFYKTIIHLQSYMQTKL